MKFHTKSKSNRGGRLRSAASIIAAVVVGALACGAAFGQESVVVADENNSRVIQYDTSGNVLQVLPGISGADTVAVGPNGDIYSGGSDGVYLYAGGGVHEIVSSGPETGIAFGPDGNLYVDQGSSIARYTNGGVPLPASGQSGATFIPSSPTGPQDGYGLTFSGNNLLVCNYTEGISANVLEYNFSTGLFVDDFVTLANSSSINAAFGPDGNLYVADHWNSQVHRYDGTTGADLGEVYATSTNVGGSGVGNAYGVAFLPSGDLLVTDRNGEIFTVNPTNGSFIGSFTSDTTLADGTGIAVGMFTSNVPAPPSLLTLAFGIPVLGARLRRRASRR